MARASRSPVEREGSGTSDSLDKLAQQLEQQIMDEARKTYSAVVIDHWMNPRNSGKMADPDGYGKVTGPCGDTMEIWLKVRGGTVAECTYLTDGCGATVACGSITTELARGQPLREAWKINQDAILEACDGLPDEHRHCAVLASNTLHAALLNHRELRRSPWKETYRRN